MENKYYCKHCDPTHKTVYSQSWIDHVGADGKLGNSCRKCNEIYSLVDYEVEKQTMPLVKFKGRGWASQDIKYQREAVKQVLDYSWDKKYNRDKDNG